MAEILVLQLAADADSAARWIVVDSNGSRLGAPVLGPLSAARIDAADRKVIVLVPPTEVLATTIDMPVKSQSKIAQALPYALEEYVAEDIDELHFAAGRRTGEGRLDVCVVSRKKLDDWLDRLHDAGLQPAAMVAETYGLARIPGTISLMLEGDTVYVNDGAETSLVMQDMGPDDALQAIGVIDDAGDDGDEAEESPRHVLVYCDAKNKEAHDDEFGILRRNFETFEVRVLPDGALPRLAVTVATGVGVNLLQGSYGPKTEYGTWLRPWRYAAALLVAAGVVGIAGKAISAAQLDRQEAELRDQFMSEYREIAPGANEVRDPIAVIRSLRERLGQSPAGASSVFLPALEQLGAAIQENDAAKVRAISYRAGVVDIRLTAPSVGVLDNIQRRIDESGRFRAEIQSTDQDEDQWNSRIQIRLAGS